jgi:hypothetical protein
MSTYKDRITLHLSLIANRKLSLSLVDSIIITSVPLVLLLLNQNWIYPKYSNLDEWMYVGLGYNYFDPAFYTTNYKISRLPWVLMEAIVRGSFPPLVSSWILAFGVLALGNIALYFALKIPFGRFPALFACIFIAGFTFMYANGGADYHNTLAGAFYCLAMLFCARCAHQRLPLRDLAFFGASIALSIHTNPLFVNLAPILFAQYLMCYRADHLNFPPLISAVFLAAVGAVGVTFLLGFINMSLGRQFLFFDQQFRLLSSFIADSSLQKPWWEPWSSYWFLDMQYLGALFAGTLLSVTTIFIAAPLKSVSARYANSIIFSAAYLCGVLIWVFWQSIGQTALQPRYFAFPLGFPLSGAVGAAMATAVARQSRTWLLTGASVCFAVATIAGIHNATLVNTLLGGFSYPLGARVAIAFSVAFAILLFVRRSLWFAPLAALALSTANAISVFAVSDYSAGTCEMNRNAYELILDAANVLRKTRIAGSKIFLFSDDGEEFKLGAGCDGMQGPLSFVHDAIGAAGDFRYVAPAWSKKTLETLPLERWKEIVATKGIIGFITYNPARIPVLTGKVEAAGGTPGEIGFFKFREGDMEIPLYILPLN